MALHIPLSVLIIGGLVGILVFAVSSAFTVWFQRNQSASELQGQPSSLSASLLKLAISVGSVVAIVFCFNAIQPHTLLDQEGLLVGKDLLTVRSRAGFIAEYPLRDPDNTATTEYIEQGQALVIFRRSPDPKELAAAFQQRDSLQEQLNLERTRRPPIDPTLQNQLNALERRLDILTQRQKELSNQQENALREEAKNNPAGNSEYRQLEQQVIMIDSEQKQTARNLQHAFNELRSADTEMEMHLHSASEMRARGLTSQREKNNRIVAYDVLQSKLHGLKERARLLEQEKAAMRTGFSEVQRRIREQLANIKKELLEVKAAKQQTTAEHEDVSKRLRAASAHEDARLSSRSRQLELQLAEVEAFIASPESPASLTVTAPWPGYVGYRDLSPASLRPDTGPLAVMYKPGHIWVELQAPLSIARDFTSANTSVQLFIHDPSTTPLAFLGHLDRKLPSPDETKVDLRISTNPPALLVRKLALGEEIQARVHIRSKGFAIASLLEQIPASLLTNQFSLPHVGGLVVVIIASLCLVLLARRTLYHRRKTLKESTINNTRNVPLIVSNNRHSGNNSSSYSRSHTKGSKLPVPYLPREGKFIFDFTDTSVDQYAPKLDLSHQEVSHIIENMALPQIQRAIEEHKKMTQTTQSLIEHQNRHPVNGTPDYNFQHWLALGRQLNQSIITNAIDLTLLATLHQQLAQQGSGVAPFIASALSKDIHADMLLGYSLELCAKRLSEVQHKGELGQAMCDLARDLCVLQLFFPALITQIIPNLQQGLTIAMRLATAEVEAETEADALLVMLQEVLASISNNQRDTSLHME
jgi:hypothetical protein